MICTTCGAENIDCFRVDATSVVNAYCPECICVNLDGDVDLTSQCAIDGCDTVDDDIELRPSLGFSRHQICNSCFRRHTDFMLDWGHNIPAATNLTEQQEILKSVADNAIIYTREKRGLKP